MKSELDPHERYLVVPAKGGWAVNLGADELHVFPTRQDAREEAARRATEARAAGRSADWNDTIEDEPHAVA